MAKQPRDPHPAIELPPAPPFEPDPALITYIERGPSNRESPIELPPAPPFEPDPELITYIERGAKRDKHK
ncbi:MAG: hypothetical protein ABR548_14455 [Actinomycetota bacterium]|nr:hypothetical protein [Actinomycetota bacterium]